MTRREYLIDKRRTLRARLEYLEARIDKAQCARDNLARQVDDLNMDIHLTFHTEPRKALAFADEGEPVC